MAAEVHPFGRDCLQGGTVRVEKFSVRVKGGTVCVEELTSPAKEATPRPLKGNNLRGFGCFI